MAQGQKYGALSKKWAHKQWAPNLVPNYYNTWGIQDEYEEFQKCFIFLSYSLLGLAKKFPVTLWSSHLPSLGLSYPKFKCVGYSVRITLTINDLLA